MFSATNLFGIAASIALAGAIALAVPFTSQQQDGATPGAEAPRLAEITSFTGQLEVLGKDQIGTREEFDWGFGRSGEQWTVRLTTTDPRYSGLSTGIHNHHQLESGGAFLQVHTSRQFTEEPDGTWLSTSHGYQDPDTTAITSVTQSTGEGLYEGLSAYVICEQEQGSMEMACHGIIFDGQWPELPSDTPDEIPATYLQP